MRTHTHTHLSVFASIIHARLNLPQLSLMVSPVCSLHPRVFHLLAWELAMLSVMEVGVLNSVSHMRTKSASLCTVRHSHAQLPKFKQTRSTLILTISTYHSGCVHSINLQFSRPMSHFSFLAADSPAFFLSCQIQEKPSDLPKTLFYGGLLRRPPLAHNEITQWL